MIERTFDVDKISSVLKHPYIWPRISDKQQDKDEWMPPMDDMHYLYDEGILFIIHELDGKHQVHANVTPESRGKAEEAAKEAVRYCFEELGAQEMTAEIPQKYGSVYGFALKFMKDVGFESGNHLLSLRAEQWDS